MPFNVKYVCKYTIFFLQKPRQTLMREFLHTQYIIIVTEQSF